MKDKNDVPDILNKQLSDLVGSKRAEKYIKDAGNSYNAVVIIITYFKCLNYLKRRPVLTVALIVMLLYLIYENYFM